MSLTSLSFLGVYFPLLLAAYYLPFAGKSGLYRKLLLLAASIGLYALAEPLLVFLLLLVILWNYLLVTVSDRTGRQGFRTLAIAADAGLLLFFKYLIRFLPAALLGRFGLLAMPVGLSYFTFKSISYVVDSKKHKGGSLIDAAIYIASFLTIVSGPLSRYEEELPCIRTREKASADDLYQGMERIVLGLAKKIVIADHIGRLASRCFLSSDLSVVMAWAGAAAYSLQIFFDFSGYTDVAVGIGRLFGFRLPENFNLPYMARSVSDFWKRWHMSLTKWFTKYIYIPLGGSRVRPLRHVFNLLAVWIVTGMWHGSNLTFIVWALVFFAFQAMEKYTKTAERINRLHLGHLYALLVVMLEWVIFRSESLSAAFAYIGSMFALNGNPFSHAADPGVLCRYAVPLVLGVLFSTELPGRMKARLSRVAACRWAYVVFLAALFVLCLIILVSQNYSAPLYAGF